MIRRLGEAAAVLAVSGCLSASGCAPEAQDELPEARVAQRTQALSSGPVLIATGTLERTTDFAGLTDIMENGLPQNVLGGIGSGLAYAGGTTFLGIPDRGPNATAYAAGTPVDNTSSFISRFETLDLTLSPASSGSLPFTLGATLKATTLFYSATPLAYGSTAGLPSGAPPANTANKFYFTGRSDNFGSGLSTNPDFARLDPEGIVVANDGNSVFIADEYGPYVYQFDRATGRRMRSFALPDHFAIANLSSLGAAEISGNSVGRVTNKGMEGLAITPDGKMLVGLVQSPLLQDGGDGGRANRIVTIDIASGETHEYVYDNQIGTKAFNSSEIIALNSHQFLIDTRDGKGLGDGSVAVIKQLWAVDIANAADVAALSGQTALLAKAVKKQRFLDLVAVLNANGIASTQIPAKIEGLAFGRDVKINDVVTHTLFVANDNDFVPDVAGPSRWFVFGFTDDDLAALNLSYEPQHVTERGADVSVGLTVPTTSVLTGSSLDYTLTVSNTGLVPTAAVSVEDVLPSELTLQACSAPAGSCASHAPGATLSFDSLAGDAAVTASVRAALSCSVANGTLVTNTASSSYADATPADNTASVAITALNPAAVISQVGVDHALLWPPNKAMIPVTVSYGVTDNCPGTSCTLSVTSNEAPSGCDPDYSVVDAHTVLLRADRNGNGAGRSYLIRIQCRDSGGAFSAASAAVQVPHNL